MLVVISKDAVRVKIIHDRAVDYVLEFTRDACKRDRTVVSNINFVGFFKKGRDNLEYFIRLGLRLL